MEKRDAYIALNMMEKIGPVKARALVAALGSPQAVFSASELDLTGIKGIGAKLACSIVEQQARLDPIAESERAEKMGVRIVTELDEEYPSSLKEMHDPPLALYLLGSIEKRDRHAIAVVGSRRCTHYGLQVADRLSYQLAQTGFTIVSGLARGIDQAGHSGALKAGGRTLAVLGSALDCLYPPEAAGLAEKIAENGAVISEFPMGREADRTTFPYRNRIISGLSMGVLVVEASRKSGALMTADAAVDQGRSVFVVPGRIDAPTARGSNALLKQGARLVDDVRDIVEEFEFLFGVECAKAEKSSAPKLELSEEEGRIVQALVADEKDVDVLSRETDLKSSRLSVLLLGLEMKGVLKMLPGKRVVLNIGL